MKLTTLRRVLLLSLLPSVTSRYLGPWAYQTAVYRYGTSVGGDDDLEMDPDDPVCQARVPRQRWIDWPWRQMKDDRLWEIPICTVKNQMPAKFKCGNEATQALDQSDNDCPTTEEGLVQRILEEGKKRYDSYKRDGLEEPLVTIKEIYKALHFLDPKTFPSDTPPDKSNTVEGPAGGEDGNDAIIPGAGVKAPGPTQDGVWGDCTKWYMVKAGNSCNTVSNNNGIGLEKFYEWNPAVNEGASGECGELWIGYAVCVGAAY